MGTQFQNANKIKFMPLPYIGMFNLDVIYQTSDAELLYQVLYKLNEIAKSQNIIIDNFQKVIEWATEQIENFTKEQLEEWLNDGTLQQLVLSFIFKNEYRTSFFNRGETDTDDTQKLQNIINLALNSNGGRIIIDELLYISGNIEIQPTELQSIEITSIEPFNNYKNEAIVSWNNLINTFSSGLILSGNFTLFTCHTDSTTGIYKGLNIHDLVVFNNTYNEVTKLFSGTQTFLKFFKCSLHIENIVLYGIANGIITTGAIGETREYSDCCYINNIQFYKLAGIGVRLGEGDSNYIGNIYCEDTYPNFTYLIYLGNNHSFTIDNILYSCWNTLSNNYQTNENGYHVYITGSSQGTINNIYAEHVQNSGLIYIDNSSVVCGNVKTKFDISHLLTCVTSSKVIIGNLVMSALSTTPANLISSSGINSINIINKTITDNNGVLNTIAPLTDGIYNAILSLGYDISFIMNITSSGNILLQFPTRTNNINLLFDNQTISDNQINLGSINNFIIQNVVMTDYNNKTTNQYTLDLVTLNPLVFRIKNDNAVVTLPPTQTLTFLLKIKVI